MRVLQVKKVARGWRKLEKQMVKLRGTKPTRRSAEKGLNKLAADRCVYMLPRENFYNGLIATHTLGSTHKPLCPQLPSAAARLASMMTVIATCLY